MASPNPHVGDDLDRWVSAVIEEVPRRRWPIAIVTLLVLCAAAAWLLWRRGH